MTIDLYWLPLGAGGNFVRLNGRIYEAVKAHRERRRPLDLYHTALEVCLPEGRFIIENAWPIPDADGASRGVVVEGPVGSPQRLSNDVAVARQVLTSSMTFQHSSGGETSRGLERCGTRTR